MHITSTAFQEGEAIPQKHSKDGGNTSPPLTFSEVPTETSTLVLLLADPDAPSGTFTHWVLYNMSPATLQIPEGELPLETAQATNDFGRQAYDGPAPPSGTHRYIFTLYALDTELTNVRPEDKAPQVRAALKDHIIDQAQLSGTYSAAG